MPHTRRALFLAALLLGACKSDSLVASSDGDPFATDNGPLTNWSLPRVTGEPQMLAVPTYDLSGQSVHPDIVAFPDGWHGAHYWVSMTPYPNSASPLENPSILQSDDGLGLAVPSGVTNPLVPPLTKSGYNSDPDLIYDPVQDELVMSYRVVADGYNTIKIITSHDGTHWTDPRYAFSEVNHSAVSQTIVPSNGAVPALAWYVDAGASGCAASSTRVMLRYATAAPMSLAAAQWSQGRPTDLRIPGYLPWHIKISYIPSKHEYWALIAAYPNDGQGCGSDDLFLAHSKNGVHWETFPQPLMRHKDHAWSDGALYRGTFLYDSKSDQLAVWFSARDADYAWHMMFVKMNYTALAAHLSEHPASRSTTADSAALVPRERWTTAP
jgi:hypothetical protein